MGIALATRACGQRRTVVAGDSKSRAAGHSGCRSRRTIVAKGSSDAVAVVVAIPAAGPHLHWQKILALAQGVAPGTSECE